MSLFKLRQARLAVRVVIGMIAVFGVIPLSTVHAADLLGLYVGGAVGQAQLEADAGSFRSLNTDDFKHNHSAYKVVAGIRPISMLGGEISYVDMGHPAGSLGGRPADVAIKGTAAFGMFYLPLPLPVVDVYAKLGMARLQSTVNGIQVLPGVGTCPINNPNCASVPFRLERTDTSFAGGLGVQLKYRSIAVRGEYERFSAAGGHPDIFFLGLTWTFL
jgi:hypothetical protein